MNGFDIEALLDFKPLTYHCEKCYALIEPGVTRDNFVCPVCKVEYLCTDQYKGFFATTKYLKKYGYKINYENLLEHCRSLAWATKQLNFKLRQVPPLKVLFEALNNAKYFVHFTTWGISHILIGALKLTSLRIPVRGVVSNVNNNKFDELTKYIEEAPNFNIIAYSEGDDWSNTPHQKLIVIDGLLAFKGSVNLTLNAWRKSATGKELLEIVTNVDEVISLHNRLFSSIWREVSDLGKTIVMNDDKIPF